MRVITGARSLGHKLLWLAGSRAAGTMSRVFRSESYPQKKIDTRAVSKELYGDSDCVFRPFLVFVFVACTQSRPFKPRGCSHVALCFALFSTQIYALSLAVGKVLTAEMSSILGYERLASLRWLSTDATGSAASDRCV